MKEAEAEKGAVIETEVRGMLLLALKREGGCEPKDEGCL